MRNALFLALIIFLRWRTLTSAFLAILSLHDCLRPEKLETDMIVRLTARCTTTKKQEM